MRAAKDRLIDAATLTPEELLAKRARELADELRKLEEAVRAGNLPGTFAAHQHVGISSNMLRLNRGCCPAESC